MYLCSDVGIQPILYPSAYLPPLFWRRYRASSAPGLLLRTSARWNGRKQAAYHPTVQKDRNDEVCRCYDVGDAGGVRNGEEVFVM